MKWVSLFVLLLSIFAMSHSQERPRPTPRHLEWQELEYYAFVHFGPNTFANQEWGHGTEKPDSFNPTALDCRQWVKTFKDAGMKQVIITAKHHDGFCLWPSKYSKHTVAQSKWKNGKGDVLAELRKACDEYKLKMGVYLSPWDRNHPAYGSPAYNQVFANTLKEVLTKYGPIYEVWFDGANGEGPNGKKQVYDWDLFVNTVRKYAPKAVIFSDAGPDIRWVGNESGIAGETCWNMIDRNKVKIGGSDQAYLNVGDPKGPDWVPAECDVSIRPGWFYHAEEDSKVKTPEQLLDIYEKSVGRGMALLLNVPPDRRGLIHENDVKALMGFKKLRDAKYKSEAPGKISRADYSGRSGSIVDVDRVFDLGKGRAFDRVVLEEDLSNGQQISKFQIWTFDAKGTATSGKPLSAGTTIGRKRIVTVPASSSKKIRVEIIGPGKLKSVKLLRSELSDFQASRDERMKWWREARFGMFIHWGLYSVPAGEWKGKNYGGASEWLMNTAKIPVADYAPLLQQFNPVNYDPKKWVQIAKDAGMKYIVITSKHHDGFSLWDTKYSDWSVMKTPYGKDLLKPLAEECKKAGIKLCFYHSIMDWTHPDYGVRRPWDLRQAIPTNMDRYTNHMKAQLKELLTNYGDIGIVWFDGEWEPQAWTHERGVDLYQYCMNLQPKTIINNRVDVHRSGMAGMSASSEAVGDYGTPEQEIPSSGIPGVDWESCMTMNGSWGFHKNDHNWKSAEQLVKNLIDCVSKGGNYLLNVGPTSLGEIPAPSIERLAMVGKWMDVYSESIHGATAGPFPKALPWGKVTRKGNYLYVHVFDKDARRIELTGFSGTITKVSELGNEGPASLMIGWSASGPQIPIPNRPDSLPADLESFPRVFVVETDGRYNVTTPPLQQGDDGNVFLDSIDAKVNGGGARYEDDPAKKCIGFWTNEKDTVEWEFVVNEPGKFSVELEVACDKDSGGSDFVVEVSGNQIRAKVPDTGSWATFVRKSFGTVELKSTGKTKLIVRPLNKKGLAVMNLRSAKLILSR